MFTISERPGHPALHRFDGLKMRSSAKDWALASAESAHRPAWSHTRNAERGGVGDPDSGRSPGHARARPPPASYCTAASDVASHNAGATSFRADKLWPNYGQLPLLTASSESQESASDLRREWDLNPRGACTPKAFQEPRIRPLCHPSIFRLRSYRPPWMALEAERRGR
jgi:hypothetical protein